MARNKRDPLSLSLSCRQLFTSPDNFIDLGRGGGCSNTLGCIVGSCVLQRAARARRFFPRSRFTAVAASFRQEEL